MSKMPMVNPLFKQIIVLHNTIFKEKWVNRRHFFLDEKNLQKLGLTGEPISVYSYYMIIPSFQSQFLVLQLVK